MKRPTRMELLCSDAWDNRGRKEDHRAKLLAIIAAVREETASSPLLLQITTAPSSETQRFSSVKIDGREHGCDHEAIPVEWTAAPGAEFVVPPGEALVVTVSRMRKT